MGTRRRSRECALQILFGLDWTGDETEAAIGLFWERFAGERPSAYLDIRRSCSELVNGVMDNRAAIDERLQACSHNWKLERMSVVDRNILRVGAYELLHRGQRVPRKVVLNEAIEIAKKFGSEDSSAFVNGVLHQVAQTLRDHDGDEPKATPARAGNGPQPSGAVSQPEGDR